MSTQMATSLLEHNIMDHCLAVLNRLMEHWQASEKTGDSEENIVSLLKPQPGYSPPDMSPFFLKQYVKVHVLTTFMCFNNLIAPLLLQEKALTIQFLFIYRIAFLIFRFSFQCSMDKSLLLRCY